MNVISYLRIGGFFVVISQAVKRCVHFVPSYAGSPFAVDKGVHCVSNRFGSLFAEHSKLVILIIGAAGNVPDVRVSRKWIDGFVVGVKGGIASHVLFPSF